MEETPRPSSDEFWRAFEGWKQFVMSGFRRSQERLLRAEARPGMKLNYNIFRRVSDGKLFKSHDSRVVNGNYVWSLVEVEDITNTHAKIHEGLELVDSDDFVGSINGVMKIDGEVYEHSEPSADWAWYVVPPVDPTDKSWPRRDPHDELYYAQNSHDHDKLGVKFVEAVEANTEMVKSWLETGYGDIDTLCRKLGFMRTACDLPDTGSISAAITRLRHYQKTGESIRVCY